MAVVIVLAATLTAGCTGSPQPMIGQHSGFGGSMMGSVPRGHGRSPLICLAPSSLLGATVFVMLADMGRARMIGGVVPVGSQMMLRVVPATVPGGRVSFVVRNMGRRTHEMVVLPLAAGHAAGHRAPGADGRVEETGSLGEASASCAAGSGEGIKAGTVGWVTLSLAPGRYELLCNLRNHYANGMHAVLTVS